MLKPKSTKKNKRKKKRLEDILGAEQRYTPLEITLDDGSLGMSSVNDATPFCLTKCKCLLFVTTIVLLLPILVYVILDQSGFEISIHPKQTPSPQENQPPIITGVAQPKQVVPSAADGEEQPSTPQQTPIEKATPKSDERAKTVANDDAASNHNDSRNSSPPSSVAPRPIPSLANMDRQKCASDLSINYHDTFQYFHQPGASFCRESVISTCQCESTVTPRIQSPEKVPTSVWQAALERNVQLAESAPSDLDVVLFGDSITEHLAGTELGQAEETWEQHSAVFDRLFTRNGGGNDAIDGLAMGIGGDASAQLLYRLQHGEVAPTLRPKVWWILIGTNDLSDNCSAEATLMGIVAVLEELLYQRPKDTIVINSILPRPRNQMGTLRGILWIKSDWINQRLECFAQGFPNVKYFDASDIFLNKDHSKAIKNRYADDWVHPSAYGTQKWGEAIVKKVKELIHTRV